MEKSFKQKGKSNDLAFHFSKICDLRHFVNVIHSDGEHVYFFTKFILFQDDTKKRPVIDDNNDDVPFDCVHECLCIMNAILIHAIVYISYVPKRHVWWIIA